MKNKEALHIKRYNNVKEEFYAHVFQEEEKK